MSTQVTTPQSAEPTDKERRRASKRRKRNRNILRAIMVPTIASLIYLLLIAPSAYVSKTAFTIQGTETAKPDLLSGIGIPAISGATNDARVVTEYLKSAEIVDHLRKKYGFAKAYSGFSLDPFARLSADAPIESAVRFWQNRAKIDYDATANIVSVSVTAYTPQDAKRLSEGVLDGATTIVDRLDKQTSDTSRKFAEAQLAEQKRIYDAVKKRVAAVRGTEAMTLDAQSNQAVMLVSQIDQEISRLKVQQAATATTYQPGAPQSRAIASQIASLEAARARAVSRAQSGPGASAAQSDIAARTALLDYEFAQKSYYAALQAYQSAVNQSDGNHRYIVAFIPPRLPESSNYWRRLWNVLAVMLASSVVLSVSMLTYSVIKDHAQ